MANTIKLQTDSILHVPLQNYDKDFTFIVNSKKYETSSFFADLLSPIISTLHMADPTIREFKIDTQSRGDFNKVLKLIQFEEEEIEPENFFFFTEIFEKLGTEKVSISEHQNEENITIDNVLNLISQHQNHAQFYKAILEKEIGFVSNHFYEMSGKIQSMIKNDENELKYFIIEDIIKNDELQIESEEQLLEFINALYMNDRKYSELYKFVIFENIDNEHMTEFLNNFDMNDLTNSTWSSLVNRLQQPILNENEKGNGRKHKIFQKHFISIETIENEFDGILNYLQTHCNIKEEINITASSKWGGDLFYLLQYENKDNYFQTDNQPNSWVCFEFKNHEIIPSNYTIRSYNSASHYHPKTWIIEGSTDNKDWIIIDEQTNNRFLNGQSLVHSFPISKEKLKRKSFKYLRIRQMGPNWYGNSFLLLNSIEFYGALI